MATGLTDRWQQRVMGEGGAVGWGTAALRGVAAGGARLYEASLDAYLGAEGLGLRRREMLPIPIVSVGNLTSGGTGKTPMTRLLCLHLAEAGKRAAILSRGHGGKGTSVRLVSDAHGNIARSAEDVGDEPVLLAQSLPGVPVLVGKDRRQSGREAMRRFALDVLVLDDGFQFWQLVRDLDIVLIDALRPFDNGHCLPRGLLREPPEHLRRAGFVVATRSESLDAEAKETLRSLVAHLAPQATLFFACHRPGGFVSLSTPDRPLLPLETLAGNRIVAWSAIARPDSFAHALEAGGIHLEAHLVQPDHHVPAPEDLAQARAALIGSGADALVMTEKDAVKWPDFDSFGVPVYALRVEMQVDDEEHFVAVVMQRLFGEDGA